MRSIVTPDTLRMREDVVQRLMASELEVVALIRCLDRPPEQRHLLDLAVYGAGMLTPAELRTLMTDCDVVFQDMYSFAHLRGLPDEDDVQRAAWRIPGSTAVPIRRPGAIREDVYTAPDAVVRLHVWSGQGSPAGTQRETPQPLIDPDLRRHLGQHLLSVTLILPPRLGRLPDGTTLQTGTRLRGVLNELLAYWADLKLR